jgi:very-short-patch-repair endonuclease
VTSLRQFLLERDMNRSAFYKLVRAGLIDIAVVKGARNTVTVLSHKLIEGEHYVICRECLAQLAAITDMHLKACCGMSFKDYVARYPGVATESTWCKSSRARTPEQREKQSRTLKDRFKTPEGEITREAIRAAAHRMQESGYRERAAEHLRKLNQEPARREATKKRTTAMWQDPKFREERAAWVEANRGYVEESAANARQHLKSTSKVHTLFKEALLVAGVTALQSEYSLGPYHLDEACPEIKLAVEVDGCYWHGCPDCGFVAQRRNRNIDARKGSYLRNRGWRVIHVRECQLKKDLSACIAIVKEALNVES